MSDRNVSRIGLVLVVLGVLSVAFWWLRGGAPGTGERDAAPAVQRAAGQAAAPTVAAAVAQALPGGSEGSGGFDGSNRSAAAAAPARSETSTAAAPAPSAIAPAVARFTDASIPVEKRSAEVEQLGKSGDANAVRTLMKLGDTYTYLNFKAVEALGNVKTPEVARYLEGKTGDKDPKIVACAMRSLGQVQGEEAIPAIAAAIAANRQRPDGFQDTVCAAGVKALGEIGSAKAIPALAEEFEKTVGKTLLHEYGSQVVAAIKAIGDASGAPALKAYAARLQKEHDAMADNPMGQRYLEGKIKETNEALNSLRK